VRQSLAVSQVLCACTLFLSLLTGVGWIFEIPLLTSVHSLLPAMQPNTAAALAVSAVAVLITPADPSARRRASSALFLGSMVALIGLLTLGQYAFGWDVGSDRIFTDAAPTTSQPFPGRPSPQTALNFGILGMALIAVNLGVKWTGVGQIGAIVAGINAIVAATGHIFGAQVLYGFPTLEPAMGMAVHTSLAFVFLAIALLCRRPNDGMMRLVASGTNAGHMVRRLLLAGIVAPPIVGGLTRVGVIAGLYNVSAQVSLFVLAMAGLIVSTMWRAARSSEFEELQGRASLDALTRMNERLNLAVRERQIFAALVQASPDFIGIADPNGKPVYLNPSGRRMVGLAPDYQIENTAIVEYYPPDRRAFAADVILKAMVESGHWEGETTFRHWQTGEAIPVSDTHFMIRSPETGETLGMGTITRNISEAKRARQEIETANTRLQEANNEITRLYEKTRELQALKTHFFANVSHEFRTPLSLILAALEKHLHAAATLAPDLRRDLEMAERSARTLVHYVDDLLDVAGLDAGILTAEYAEADAAQLVRFVSDYFAVLAKDKRIEFAIDAPATLPIQVDPDKVQRMLLNVLANAFRFTPAGGHVRVSVRQDAGRFRIEVGDSGPGIPEDRRPAVFERFRRFEAGPPGSSGTGLGLSIVRDFAALLGGSVTIGDAPEGGALFILDLPRTAPAGTAVTQRHARGPIASRVKDQVDSLREISAAPVICESPDDGRDALVLVVEDNPEMNQVVAESLTRDGFRVITAFDGREGYEKAVELRPDLILTDIMMPRMSGDELIRSLRQRAEFGEVPIVVLTARADKDFRLGLLRGGADDYLAKPFSAQELCARVRNLVIRKRAQESSNRLRKQLEDVAHASKTVAEAVAGLPESSMQAVLHTIVLNAASLTSAEFAAVGIGTDPDRPFETWAFSGLSHEQALRIGSHPRPIGVLGAVAKDNQTVRVRDLRTHPAYRGFPPHHPVMSSFIGVPIRYKGEPVGNIFVANKLGVPEFSEQDQRLVEMLAESVGVAIETARLYSAEGAERAWLETVVDQMPEGVLLMDAEGRVTAMNQFIRSLAAADPPGVDRFGNRIAFDLRHPSGEPLSPDDLPIVKALMEKVTTQGHELIARRTDGRIVPLLVGAAPIRTANGELAGATMILQDASTLKKLEQLREEWASVVSHDLQQPIHTILLRSDLLTAGALDQQQAEHVRQIRITVQRLERMVNDLLDASQLEARGLRIFPERLDIGELVREIAGRSPAAARVTFHAPETHRLFVQGDAGRLEQVLLNLLSNATKYGEPDTAIQLDVSIASGQAKVSVTNTGPGIDADELPLLFERYARSRSTITSTTRGLGLGLYIAKGLIEAHGGRIWAESVPDRTTAFHFTLPLDGPPVAAAQPVSTAA
jgi:PAS domain S-box-containing protein